MDEFRLISKYFNRSQSSESVAVGIGDDCAVLIPPVGQHLVASVDTAVAGKHFPERNAPPDMVAARALHCAVSDLAAMGAEPLWFTLALTLPSADEGWLKVFSDGLFATADLYGIQLVGGDTSRGPLCISIQVHGAVPSQSVLLRRGAALGDQVFVTGFLGDAAAGLEIVSGRLETDEQSVNYLTQRYWQPEARIRVGLLLRYMASAVIDISDGLIADLGHLCSASQVSAKLDATRIPLSQALLASVSTAQALEWALTGGDDYQLCFTASPEHAEQLKAQARNRVLDVCCIGEIVEGEGVIDARSQKPFQFKRSGFQHFV